MAAPIGHSQLSGSTAPQHSTFAASSGDVLKALSFYFGQPVSPEKLKDYGEHHAATYHFPGTFRSSATKMPHLYSAADNSADMCCISRAPQMPTPAPTHSCAILSTI